MYQDITSQVWEYLQKQPTEIAKKVLEALDYDICFFYTDGDSITLEKTYAGANIPDYLFNYMRRNNNKIIAYSLGLTRGGVKIVEQ